MNKKVFSLLAVWRKHSNSFVSEFHGAFHMFLCDDFFKKDMVQSMGTRWKNSRRRGIKGRASDEKKGWEWICRLVPWWLSSYIDLHLLHQHKYKHLRFANDTKVGDIINTGANHCTALTAQPWGVRSQIRGLKWRFKQVVLKSTHFCCETDLISWKRQKW